MTWKHYTLFYSIWTSLRYINLLLITFPSITRLSNFCFLFFVSFVSAVCRTAIVLTITIIPEGADQLARSFRILILKPNLIRRLRHQSPLPRDSLTEFFQFSRRVLLHQHPPRSKTGGIPLYNVSVLLQLQVFQHHNRQAQTKAFAETEARESQHLPFPCVHRPLKRLNWSRIR